MGMRYSKKYIKYILFIVIIGIIASTAFIYSLSKKENSLSVDAMYLLKNDEGKDEINISGIIYLTNIRAVSGSVKIIAYLTERWNGIALYKKEVEVGRLSKDKTTEIEFEMSIKNGSYSLEILVFEDDLLRIKGGGWIQVYHEMKDEAYTWRISVQDVMFYEIH